MNNLYRFLIIMSILSSLFIVCISAAPAPGIVSFTGQILYEDLEGGLFGVLTDDNERYQLIDLPEQYKIPGLFVRGTGYIPEPNFSIQMWGEPLIINEISLQNAVRLRESSWSQLSDGKVSLPDDSYQMGDYLIIASSSIQNGLNQIDETLKISARNMSGKNFNKGSLSPILSAALNESLGVYETSAVDISGIIVDANPLDYHSSIGQNVSSFPYFLGNSVYAGPAMSELIYTIEGKNAVILYYPTFSNTSTCTGTISSLIDIPVFIENRIKDIFTDDKYSIMVIEPDGTILYDLDKEQIGKSTWDDIRFNIHPELINVALKMQTTMSGFERYEFSPDENSNPIKKKILWTTVSLHGTSWRVAIHSPE